MDPGRRRVLEILAARLHLTRLLEEGAISRAEAELLRAELDATWRRALPRALPGRIPEHFEEDAAAAWLRGAAGRPGPHRDVAERLLRIVWERIAARGRAAEGEVAARPAAGPAPSAPVAEVPPEPARPAEKAAASEALARRAWFQSFLEGRDLSWGEVIAGLLVVGGAIALVLTFWQRIGQTFRYLCFLAFTLAIGGAGHYALRRLRLPVTGKSLLVMGMLLVPLNYLAIDIMELATGMRILSLAALTLAAAAAARPLVARAAMPVALGLSFASGTLLLFDPASRLGSRAIPYAASAILVLASLATYLVFRIEDRDAPDAAGRDAAGPFHFALGIVAFGALVAVARAAAAELRQGHFHLYGPLLMLWSLPPAGWAWRLRREGPEAQTWRVVYASLATALFGLAYAASIPHWRPLLAVAGAGAALLALAAIRARRRAMAVMALGSLTLSYEILCLWMASAAGGEAFRWDALDAAQTAVLLLPLAVAAAVGSLATRRAPWGGPLQIAAIGWTLAAAVLAWPDRFTLWWVAGVLAAAHLAVSLFAHRRGSPLLGFALAYVCLDATLVRFGRSTDPEWSLSCLLFAPALLTAALSLGAWIHRRRAGPWPHIEGASAWAAWIAMVPLGLSAVIFVATENTDGLRVAIAGLLAASLYLHASRLRRGALAYAGSLFVPLAALAGLIWVRGQLEPRPTCLAIAALALAFLAAAVAARRLSPAVFAAPLAEAGRIGAVLVLAASIPMLGDAAWFASLLAAVAAALFCLAMWQTRWRPAAYLAPIAATAAGVFLTLQCDAPGPRFTVYAIACVLLVLSAVWAGLGLAAACGGDRRLLGLRAGEIGAALGRVGEAGGGIVLIGLAGVTFAVVGPDVQAHFAGVVPVGSFLPRDDAWILLCLSLAGCAFLNVERARGRIPQAIVVAGLLPLAWAARLPFAARPVPWYVGLAAAYAASLGLLVSLRPAWWTGDDRRAALALSFAAAALAALLPENLVAAAALLVLGLVHLRLAWTGIFPGGALAGAALASGSAFFALNRLLLDLQAGVPDWLTAMALAAALLGGLWVAAGVDGIPRWRRPFEELGDGLALGATGIGLLLCYANLWGFSAQQGWTSWRAAGALGGAALAMAAGLQVWAAVRRRSPWFLLAAEGSTGLAYHLIVTGYPELLRIRIFGSLWPFTVLFLAFVGLAVGQILSRRGRPFLGEPLAWSGLGLPIASIAGAFANLAAGTWTPSMTAGLLSLASAFYFVGGQVRGQPALAWTGGGLLNAASYVVWSRIAGVPIAEHPQLYLIPVGATLLAGSILGRKQLEPVARRTLEASGTLLVLGSSAADMLIGGPLTAAILACFAVSFALWGIAARLRLYLYAGVVFVAIDVVTQVVRAALERAWIWWVSAIVLGLGLMALFAWFERRRDEVRRIVEEVKTWR